MLSSADRLTKARQGPWGPWDGSVAGGPDQAGGRMADLPPFHGGNSLITGDMGRATVDSLQVDAEGHAWLPSRGTGTVVPAGRLNRGVPQ